MAIAQTTDEYGNPIETDIETRAQQSANGYSENPFAAPATTQPKAPVAFTPQQRDSVVQGWLKSSYSTNRQGVEQYLGSLGSGSGWNVTSDDKVTDPNGRMYDWIGNVNTADAQKRSGYTTDGRYASVTGSKQVPARTMGSVQGAGSAAAASAAARASSTVSQSVAPVKDPRLDELYNMLMGRATQGLDVDKNTPVIRQQADAYAANEERARRNYLGDLAEEAGPLANIRGETRMSAERVGQRTGGYEAELMGRELTAKRAEIADALSSMQGLLTTEQQLALTMKLKQMDDQIARMKLSQDGSQFNADLAYRNSALAQQGSQFGQQMGYSYDTFDWDRSPMNPRNMPTGI